MKPRRPLSLFTALSVSLFLATPALPHSGTLDDLGCHKNRLTSYYHCHEGPLAGRKFAQPTGARRALKKLQAEQHAEATSLPRKVATTSSDPYGPYRATVAEVLEGGLLKLDVAVWPGLSQRVVLQLSGLVLPDPEAASPCETRAAGTARKFTGDWLEQKGTITIDGVELSDTPGQVRGDLYRSEADLGQALLKKGLARPAEEAGNPWC